MKRSMMLRWFVLMMAVFGLVPIIGCASYYKVKDPQTGNVYYTEKVDYISGGAVRMMDARTGNMVTIQNSEVKEISNDEYKKGLSEPVSKPAVTPAAAPAAAAPATTPAESPKSAPSGT